MICRCLRTCFCGGNSSPSSNGDETPETISPPRSSLEDTPSSEELIPEEPLPEEPLFPMDQPSDEASSPAANLPGPSPEAPVEGQYIYFGLSRDLRKETDWLQTRGAQVVRWIEDPAEPDCPIPRNSLTVEQLENEAIVFPEEFEMLEVWTTYRVYFGKNIWIGHVTPGIIVMQNISRIQESPNVSEIALTVYYREYETVDDLRHIYFTTVENNQTRFHIMNTLYPSWPPASEDTITWEHGTPEFEQVLGTRLGRLAGYVVLGGFDRGTRRVARIVAASPCFGMLDLRFDIEPTM
jgi:hypothetical protein